EVILMEQQLRVRSHALAENDAIPEVGWAQFNEELNSEVRDLLSKEDLTVRFNIENGLATEVDVTGASSSEVAHLIRDFIQDKIKWEGTRGEVRIEVIAKE